MNTGIGLIASERQRQITDEGWSAKHDDEHTGGELVLVALSYLAGTRLSTWPRTWDPRRFKPSPQDHVRELTKAGALIAAEIDRLLRQQERARVKERTQTGDTQ